MNNYDNKRGGAKACSLDLKFAIRGLFWVTNFVVIVFGVKLISVNTIFGGLFLFYAERKGT